MTIFNRRKEEEVTLVDIGNDTNKNYRLYLVECVKAAGQMVIDMAEDIVGQTDCITNLVLELGFDQEYGSIPEITIVRTHLPDRETTDRLLDIYIEKLKKENKDE